MPYCAVMLTITPLDEGGMPMPGDTLRLAGVGGPITIEEDRVIVRWQRDDKTGVMYYARKGFPSGV